MTTRRDWQADWELCRQYEERFWGEAWLDYDQNVLTADFAAEASDALPYWLKRAQELEAQVAEYKDENSKLRHVIESYGITLNDAMVIERHLNEMGKDTKWMK